MNKKQLLEKLKNKILKELNDDLAKQATNLVFGKGNPEAQILFIGEAPGEKEDLQGIPFVGRAGKQLDKLLNRIGLNINDVYIANILKYRPPKNRDPNKEEIKEHTPYLIEQIKIIKPKIIATLGNFSTKFILSGCKPEDMKKIAGIAELHGKPQEITFDGTKVLVVPIYHPAAIMYRPSIREDLENDFEIMRKIIKKKKPKIEKNMSLDEY